MSSKRNETRTVIKLKFLLSVLAVSLWRETGHVTLLDGNFTSLRPIAQDHHSNGQWNVIWIYLAINVTLTFVVVGALSH